MRAKAMWPSFLKERGAHKDGAAFFLRLICTNGLVSKAEVSAAYKHVSLKVFKEFPQVVEKVSLELGRKKDQLRISLESTVEEQRLWVTPGALTFSNLTRRMGSLGKHLSRPLVQALARCASRHKRLRMDLRRDAKHEFARRRFFRLAAHGLAVGKIVVYGGCEALFEGYDCLAMKTDTVLNSQNPSHKDVVTRIELDASFVAFECHHIHHDLTSSLSNHSRSSST